MILNFNAMKKKLYLFTGGFPYFKFLECFLEDEIVYLSKSFAEVIIIPFEANPIRREVPENCTVKNPIMESKFLYFLRGLYNRRAFPILIKEFFREKVYFSWKRFVVWIKCYLQSNNYMNSPIIKQLDKEITQHDICYHYWGKWSNVISVFMNSNCHHVSRFHGFWDLWEEDFDNYAPLRSIMVETLDYEVFISTLGQKYFNEKYPKSNTVFSPLGTSDFGIRPQKSTDTYNIVSCSSVYPLKRVPLILESVVALAQMHPETKYSWTHIGSGETFKDLMECVSSHSKMDNLSINLEGAKSHDEVLKIYQDNHFDAFVNLSISEGVPVSIMEAISFDIPIVATNVGGTSDIVCDATGVLVSQNPIPLEVANAFDNVFNVPRCPRKFWATHYSAELNYGNFAKFLETL